MVSRFPDHLDVFWAADDGGIWSTWWNANQNGGRWNAPFPISSANVVPPGGHVAVVARRANHLDVFWADNGGAIGTQWWNGDAADGGWHAHQAFRITGTNVVPPGAPVAVVSRQPDHLDVFWADNGGAIGTHWWNGQATDGGWDRHPAFRITDPNVVPPGGGVAAVARRSDHLDVFWADNGGAVGTHWWNGSAQNGGGIGILPSASPISTRRRPGAAWPRSHDIRISSTCSGPTAAGPSGRHWWNGQAQDGNWDRHPAFRITAPKRPPREVTSRRWRAAPITWTCSGPTTEGPSAPTGGMRLPTTAAGTFPSGSASRTSFQPADAWLSVRASQTSGRLLGRHASRHRLQLLAGSLAVGAGKYWSDLSYGRFDIDGSRVFGWMTMPETQAQFMAKDRDGKIDACIGPRPPTASTSATTLRSSRFQTSSPTPAAPVAEPFSIPLRGRSVGRVTKPATVWGWITVHDSPVSCSPANDGRPGAYSDGWDIMSFACYGGLNPMFTSAATFGASGPGLMRRTATSLAGFQAIASWSSTRVTRFREW